MNVKKLSLDILIYRNRNRLSLSQVEKRYGINRNTMRMIENGRTPYVPTLERICAMLGTHPGDYF